MSRTTTESTAKGATGALLEPPPGPEAGVTRGVESPTGETGDAITGDAVTAEDGTAADGKTEAVPEQAAQSPPASQAVDLYDWDRTLITVTLSLLPGEPHPEGRPVALSIHSPGEVPLFRAPVRLHDLTIEQIQRLIAEYQASLPGRKEQKEVREQEKAAAATAAPGSPRKSALPPPSEHLNGTKTKPTETFNERAIGLFG